MSRLPNVRLDLPNRPENVLVVRETLTAVAETVGLDSVDLSDIRTAVTEACNNVVLHAYGGGDGRLEVAIEALPGTVRVLVRDHGVGLGTGWAGGNGDGEMGLGLPVIEALTSRVEFSETPGSGTEVRMEFATPGASPLPAPSEDSCELPLAGVTDAGATAAISIAPAILARAVLPRVLSVLAARAHFSTDRISDSQLLADALVAHAGGSIRGGYLSMTVNVEPRDLQLRVGPLIAGGGERLVLDSELAGFGAVLERLADHHGVTSSDSHDVLTLQLLDRR